MDNWRHYVPVLRWKKAEREALLHISHVNNPKAIRLTPLLELTRSYFKKASPPTPKPVGWILGELADEVLDHWGYEHAFFLDLWHLDPTLRCENGDHPLITFSDYAKVRSLRLIPVTGLDDTRTSDYQAAVAHAVHEGRHGVCIRLRLQDLPSRNLKDDLGRLLEYLAVSPQETDLIVDCQYIDPATPDSVYISLCETASSIPFIYSWRTFTVLSGAFPVDLTHIKKHSQENIQRADWLLWTNLAKRNLWEPRVPGYGDYTIQHPLYVPKEHIGSASIRYACNEYWVIMRGESLKLGQKYQQYPALAQLLCEREEFCGSEYSAGDKYIYNISEIFSELGEVENTGNATTWLWAGINHHLAVAMHQLANFRVT